MRADLPILPLRLEEVVYAAGGQRLVDGISLDLAPGPRSIILGANGAGKSLLLRLCHGLLAPTSGRIVWQGPGAALGAQNIRRRQAMVFQRPVLLRRSAAANIDYALALRGLSRRERGRNVAEALERVGLSGLADRPARVLSGGEQQRLALARAWALHPEILFLDEPTASLDPAATRAVEQVIDAFQRAGTKIVMTTHDLGQARRLADEVIFLHHGRVCERSPADAFFRQPASEAGRAFLSGDLLW
jgi:tungstate transport system ATP-binding protein